MKYAPPSPRDSAPEAPYLSPEKLAEIRQALVNRYANNMVEFHRFLNHPEDCNHAAYGRFEQLMHEALNSHDGSLEQMEFDEPACLFDGMSKDTVQALLPKLKARLEKEIRFYVDKKDNYTLILPQRFMCGLPGEDVPKDPDALEDRVYDKMLMLFHSTILPKALGSGDYMHGSTEDHITDRGAMKFDRFFAYDDKHQALKFISNLLPTGMAFADKDTSQARRLN